MSAPRLVLERMMHRQSIAVPGESLASYALLKLVPAGDGPRQPPAHPRPVHRHLRLDVLGGRHRQVASRPRARRGHRRHRQAQADRPPGPGRLRQRGRGGPAADARLPRPRQIAETASPHRHVQRRSGRHDDGRGHQPRPLQTLLDPGRGRPAVAGRRPDRRRDVRRADCRELARQALGEEGPLHHHGRRHRVEQRPHQGPGQGERRPLVLHRRRPGRRGHARLPGRVRPPGRHDLRQRRAWTSGRSRTSRSSGSGRWPRRSGSCRSPRRTTGC